MEIIHVPAPPREAFNKHRRVSDLIRKQVEHFKHLENKLPADLRGSIPQHHVVTEDDAARYIAAMTRLLRSQSAPAGQAKAAPVVMPDPASRATGEGLSLAAAGEHPAASKSSKPANKRASRSKKANRK